MIKRAIGWTWGKYLSTTRAGSLPHVAGDVLNYFVSLLLCQFPALILHPTPRTKELKPQIFGVNLDLKELI